MVIDAHLHLWDTRRQPYAWLQRPENSAINRVFGFEDFRSRAAATPVGRAVLVQADDTAGDTEAMFEVAAAHPEVAGVWPGCRLTVQPRRLSSSTGSRRGRVSPASAT